MMKKYLFVLTVLMSAFFAPLSVASSSITQSHVTLKEIRVQAANVSAVEVIFTTKVVRGDCNKIAIQLTEGSPTKIGGNDVNWNKRLFVEGRLISTKMYCPIPEAIEEVVESGVLLFEAYTDNSVDGEIDLSFLVPIWMDIVVEEIR